MHELSIAMSMIEMATDELKKNDGTRVEALPIGENEDERLVCVVVGRFGESHDLEIVEIRSVPGQHDPVAEAV